MGSMKRGRSAVNYSENVDDEHNESESEEVESSQDEEEEYAAAPKSKRGKAAVSAKAAKTVKPKQRAAKPVAIEKKLLAMPHGQLCATLAAFLGEDPALQEQFMASLPAVDISSFTVKLDQASRAISKALPNTRWGSSTDHFGYKRCCSAVTAFKKLWNEHVAILVNGDKDALVNYSTEAVETLDSSVSFNSDSDNKYKQLCGRKLAAALKKTLKAKGISTQTRQSAEELVAGLAQYE